MKIVNQMNESHETKLHRVHQPLRNFWAVPAMESQKAVEESQNKENINDSRGFVVLQKQLAFFSISRNKQVILDSW